MRGQEVCVCVCVCLSIRSRIYGTLRFSIAPLEPQMIFDRGLLFSSPREAGSFTSARKCQIRGKIRGKIRG